MKKQLSGFLILFFLCHSALGDELLYDLKTKTETQKNFLSVGPEVSSISGTQDSLQGFGAAIQYTHAFTSDWAAGVTLSQHFNGSGDTGTVLYSGFSANVAYAILGSLQANRQTLSYKGRSILEVKKKVQEVWTVGVSIDQLFLNGTEQVFPATGVVLATAYQTTLFGIALKPSVGFGQLSGANDQALTIMKIGVLFDFSI